MGGTCAVDLAVMHPDMFSAFEDIAGDIGPNSGNKEQTIARLFGGNADAWAAFDPTTVITKHGPYTGVAGWFDVNGSTATIQRAQERPGAAANSLCALGAANGINCAVVNQPGKHDWPFARTRSPLPCRGWPVRSARPTCRRPRCRLRREPHRLNKPPRGDNDRLWRSRCGGGCSHAIPIHGVRGRAGPAHHWCWFRCGPGVDVMPRSSPLGWPLTR